MNRFIVILLLLYFFLDGSAVDSAVTPTSPLPPSGNGVVAQPKKIRGVGFGDIFREGSVKLKVRLPSTETEEKKERVSGMYSRGNTSHFSSD